MYKDFISTGYIKNTPTRVCFHHLQDVEEGGHVGQQVFVVFLTSPARRNKGLLHFSNYLECLDLDHL